MSWDATKAPAPARIDAALKSLDLLATSVAVVQRSGIIFFANAAFEDALGTSRRAIQGTHISHCFTEPELMDSALIGAIGNEFATLRYDAKLKRLGQEPMPVHVIVTPIETTETAGDIMVELLPIEQQTKQDREERVQEQAQANKELIRNLAHEIKNPLGGIRGAAQLLEMEITKSLHEYTQVIIHEADRLQSLVDRLLAPHRKPHVVGDVNIHEVCERVRSLVLAEFPTGLSIKRQYDISIPEFRGDREQLIQALLNIVHNASYALENQIQSAKAEIVLQTRIARQVTFGKQRYKLALELHVIDNGPGIPEAIKERIFYPLVSGREGGSGLGLTLAQTFVGQHNGLIECDSVPGRTDFKILIPLH